MSGPDYLFDPNDPVDPAVAELERLLGRFGHGGRELRAARGRRWRAPLAMVLAAAAVVVAAVFALREPPEVPEALRLVRGHDGGALGIEEWFEATADARELSIDGHAHLTLDPGSRLQVRRLDAEASRLYLANGRLEAFVFPSVRARFFQVETQAATCVDLGCRYTLDVDPSTGTAHVRVTMGQVAFEDRGREVFVPRGAECRAEPGRGAGTPRFSDCDDALRAALDRFDAAEGPARRGLVAAVTARATSLRDTLPLWHLLAADDEKIRRPVEEALVRLAGMPPGVKGRADRARWRDHLEPDWW